MQTTTPPERLPTVRSLGHDLALLLAARARGLLLGDRAALRVALSAHARAWRCAALVVAIALVSAWVAWLAWDTTEEQRQTRTAAQSSVDGRLEGSLVDTDLTRDLERRRGDAPGQGRREPARPPAGTAGGSGGSSAVGGWLVSLASVSGVLAVGAGAAAVVVRRHRRRADLAQPAPEPLRHAWVPADDDDPDPEAELVLPDQRDAEADHPLELAGSSLDERAVGAVLAPTGLSTAESAVLVGEPVASRIESHERVYERRGAQRVDYVQPGTIDWRGAHWSMSVRDLSGTGLRLRITPEPDARLPAANDYVQVDFPVDGGQVRVAAQIAWRRSTPDGTEMGVVFRALRGQDAELIRATCGARG